MHLRTQRRKNNSFWLAGPGTVPVTDPLAVPATTHKNPCFNENHNLRYEGSIKSLGKFSGVPLLNFAALSLLLTFLMLTFLQKSRYSRNLLLSTRNLLTPDHNSADAVPFPTELINKNFSGLDELSEESEESGGIKGKEKDTKVEMADETYT